MVLLGVLRCSLLIWVVLIDCTFVDDILHKIVVLFACKYIVKVVVVVVVV